MVNKYIIPLVVLFIVFYGFFKKVDIYDSFIEGAINGLKIVVEVIPAMLALVFAVNVFVSSGFLDMLFGSNNEVLSLAILRPISGNASLAMLNNIYTKYGVDSFNGMLGSVMQGATDTTIYVLALYFSSIRIKKSRYALWVGLFADVCGLLAAYIVVRYIF